MEQGTILSEATKQKITISATWARYAAILSFVSVGISALQLIVGILKDNSSVLGSLFSFLISTVISIVLAISLLNYSKHTTNSLNQNDNARLFHGLNQLKIYFTIMGVLFIIVLGLLALGVLIGLAALAFR